MKIYLPKGQCKNCKNRKQKRQINTGIEIWRKKKKKEMLLLYFSKSQEFKPDSLVAHYWVPILATNPTSLIERAMSGVSWKTSVIPLKSYLSFWLSQDLKIKAVVAWGFSQTSLHPVLCTNTFLSRLTSPLALCRILDKIIPLEE